jgi:hypothetical protein
MQFHPRVNNNMIPTILWKRPTSHETWAALIGIALTILAIMVLQ